jgi:Carboxypeptidase regulatory-like domain/Peptidase family M1 domain
MRLTRFLVALALCAGAAGGIRADTIAGTVKDPQGQLVAGARIEITGGELSAPIVLASDGEGNFSVPDLKPGKYSVRITQSGFEPVIQTVDLHGSADLPLTLTLAAQQSTVVVTGRSTGYANSDPDYVKLRNIGLGDSVKVDDVTLNLDVGSIHFKTGTLTYLTPIEGLETGAVFTGQGHFSLKPITALDTKELTRRTGGATVEEDFDSVVLRYSRDAIPKFHEPEHPKIETPAEAGTVFLHWQERVRHRHEDPAGFTQETFESETIDNVDADELASIYNPQHPIFINAYIRGTQHKDLRFFIRTRVGAIPQLLSPEEVALINFSGDGMDDGIWYADHLRSEIVARTANSLEDRRLFSAHAYKIETAVGKNDHLYSRATIRYVSLVAGERVVKFGLLPNLRVTRVVDAAGKELHYVQQGRKEDGSFYVVLDQAPAVGAEQSMTVEYEGDQVLHNAGGGSYYVGSREAWYPNMNQFGEKSLFDLTFKVPPKNKVISVGKLQGDSAEDGFAVSHWVTPVPIAVAGFNYGQYSHADITDSTTKYNIAGYYLTDLPDSLKRYATDEGSGAGDPAAPPDAPPPPGKIVPRSGTSGIAPLAAMSPLKMTKYALDQTRAQMQLCTFYFGRAPYDDISITEQPNVDFGQSWPALVYLPILAYIDSTQRWLMFGTIDPNTTGFVREVTPHEVAHQWWGHGVAFASYHDEWLSEGFAEFSAGLFLQQAMPGKWEKDYLQFWDEKKKRILEKNNFGVAPNDAGPLWLGRRLDSPKSESAYFFVTYAKGAYVLQMLRSMMYDDDATKEEDKEKPFIDMMHDFVDAHREQAASTESFMAVGNKHIPAKLDLLKNGRLDWFFQEWVYGTDVPHYESHYDITPGTGGGVRVKMEITQSQVEPNFAMFIPIFADFGKGMVRLNQVEMVGDSTRTIEFSLPSQPKKIVLNYFKDVLER